MKHFTTIIAVLSIALSSTNARLLDASSTSTWSKQTASDPQDEEDTALPETRVVGGTIAAQGDFPWFVASAGFVSCGGSLVYEDVFLSAAHCDEAFPIGSEVYVGALYRNSPNGGAQKRIITKLLRHPDFDGNHLRNDVMLMKLDSPVDVEPILLNSNELAPEPGETLTAMGFGRLEEEGNAAYFLRQVNITAYDFQRCEDQYENVLTTDGTERLVLDEQVQMCAGYSRGGKGTCQGDSGVYTVATFARSIFLLVL